MEDLVGLIELEEHDGQIYRLQDYYDIQNYLGRGGFGLVVEAYDRYKNQQVALKIVKKKEEVQFKALKKEAKILEKMSHPNIATFKFFKVYHEHGFLGMERVKGVTLQKFISSQQQVPMDDRLQWEQICQKIMIQLFQAVHYLHQTDHIHRDIKPSNIVIDEDSLQIKLIDFGLAISSNKNNQDQRCGTILYEAPEQLFAINQYTKAVDIWACGVVMYELLTIGGHPIIDRLAKQDYNLGSQVHNKSAVSRNQFKNIISNLHKVEVRELLEGRASDICTSLLESLLSVSQSTRYKSEQIIKHPWITKEGGNEVPESQLQRQTKLVKCYSQLAKVFGTSVALPIMSQKQTKRDYVKLMEKLGYSPSKAFKIMLHPYFSQRVKSMKDYKKLLIDFADSDYNNVGSMQEPQAIQPLSRQNSKDLEQYKEYLKEELLHLYPQDLLVSEDCSNIPESEDKPAIGSIKSSINLGEINQSLRSSRRIESKDSSMSSERGTPAVAKNFQHYSNLAMLTPIQEKTQKYSNQKYQQTSNFGHFQETRVASTIHERNQQLRSQRQSINQLSVLNQEQPDQAQRLPMSKNKKTKDKSRVIIQSPEAHHRKQLSNFNKGHSKNPSLDSQTNGQTAIHKSSFSSFNKSKLKSSQNLAPLKAVCSLKAQDIASRKSPLQQGSPVSEQKQNNDNTSKFKKKAKVSRCATTSGFDKVKLLQSKSEERNEQSASIRSPKGLPNELLKQLSNLTQASLQKGKQSQNQNSTTITSCSGDQDQRKLSHFPMLPPKNNLRAQKRKDVKSMDFDNRQTQTPIDSQTPQLKPQEVKTSPQSPIDSDQLQRQILQSIRRELKQQSPSMEGTSFLQNASARQMAQEEIQRMKIQSYHQRQSLAITGSSAKVFVPSNTAHKLAKQ